MSIWQDINTFGAKVDVSIAGAAVGTGTFAPDVIAPVPDSLLQDFGPDAMIAGGLVLLAIRIAISGLRLWRDYRSGT